MLTRVAAVAVLALAQLPAWAQPTGQTYRNTNYGFQFAVPAGWAVRETGYYVAHYSLVFLTVNSQRPGLEIRDWPTGTNSWGFGAGTTFQQMQPGEVHVDVGYSGGPGPETMSPDTVGTNLHSLLAGKGIAVSGQAGLSCLNLGFIKRGHRWAISAYLRDPVTEENQGKVMSMLRSFEFLDVPVGNAGWAESLAWEALPENIRAPADWRGWPLASSAGEGSASTQLGPKSVVVKKVGSDYSVKFVWDAVGTWEYLVSANGKVTQPQPAITYPVSVASSQLPSELPGQSQGRNDGHWLAPYVRASRVLGKTTVTWFAQDGSVTRQPADAQDTSPDRGFVSVARPTQAVEGINEDWRIVPHPPAPGPISGHITGTPDSRVFLDQFSPKPGLIALDIYIHGKRVNTVGPFIPCYPSTDAVLNDDGSAALLVWKNEGKTNAQIVVLNNNGHLQFQADCGRAVHSPIVAPDGVGVLLRPNTGGSDQNTFMWFTKQGRQRSLDISPNPWCAGWIPASRKSLFWTSVGDEPRHWHLIDWDTGQRLWDIPSPGPGRPLAIGLTSNLILFGIAEPYHPSFAGNGQGWLRTFYAVKVSDGSLAARWQAQLPRRFLDAGSEHFLRLGSRLFYIAADEFTELSLEDIVSKSHGWR